MGKILDELEIKTTEKYPGNVEFSYNILSRVYGYHKHPVGVISEDGGGEYYEFSNKEDAIKFFYTRSKAIKPNTFGISLETPVIWMMIDIFPQNRTAYTHSLCDSRCDDGIIEIPRTEEEGNKITSEILIPIFKKYDVWLFKEDVKIKKYNEKESSSI